MFGCLFPLFSKAQKIIALHVLLDFFISSTEPSNNNLHALCLTITQLLSDYKGGSDVMATQALPFVP